MVLMLILLLHKTYMPLFILFQSAVAICYFETQNE